MPSHASAAAVFAPRLRVSSCCILLPALIFGPRPLASHAAAAAAAAVFGLRLSSCCIVLRALISGDRTATAAVLGLRPLASLAAAALELALVLRLRLVASRQTPLRDLSSCFSPLRGDSVNMLPLCRLPAALPTRNCVGLLRRSLAPPRCNRVGLLLLLRRNCVGLLRLLLALIFAARVVVHTAGPAGR